MAYYHWLFRLSLYLLFHYSSFIRLFINLIRLINLNRLIHFLHFIQRWVNYLSKLSSTISYSDSPAVSFVAPAGVNKKSNSAVTSNCTPLPRVPSVDRLHSDRVDNPCSSAPLLRSSTKTETSSAAEESTTSASVVYCAPTSGSKSTASVGLGVGVANTESLSPWQRPFLPGDQGDVGQGQSSLSDIGMTNGGRWFYSSAVAVASSNVLNSDHDIYGRVSIATDAGLSSSSFGWCGSYGPAEGMNSSYSAISSHAATREMRTAAQQTCHMAAPFRVTTRPLPGPYFYGYSDSDNCTKF